MFYENNFLTRPTCPIGDWHAWGEPCKTKMPAEFNWNFNTDLYLNILYTFCLFQFILIMKGLQSGMSDFNYACRSPMCLWLGTYVGLRPSMSVSNGLSIRYVGLWRGMSVSDGSPMKHVKVSDVSSIRHLSLW